MKRFVLLVGIALAAALPVAAESDRVHSDENCKILLVKAEEVPDDKVYTDCGFDDEGKAWNTWAPYVSSRKMKRALFELCRRYPNHEYGALYCQKAIDLNYGPALAYQGFTRLKTGDVDEALALFTEALKTGDLDAAETTRITETLGLLYVREGSAHYNPKAGAALLSKASGERSAVANNALGYLYFSGKADLKPDMKEAFTCFWRAILIGCPAAEENLGVFHLVRQKKISWTDAIKYMSPQAFTCTPAAKPEATAPKVQKMDCPCDDVLNREAFFQSQPYLYVGWTDDGKAVLQDKSGKKITVQKGSPVSENTFVAEVRPRAVILLQNASRIILNRYHEGACVDYCLNQQKNPPKPQAVVIKPYRLTFTPRECADLTYYASYLVDTSLPYVGREECRKYERTEPELDEATRLLLGIESPTGEADAADAGLEAAKKAAGI